MQNLENTVAHSSAPRFAGLLRDLPSDERGASFIEYVIVVGLVAMVCIGAFNLFGGAVDTRIKGYTTQLNGMKTGGQ